MSEQWDQNRLTQSQVANMLDVDRSTINSWGKKGMPFKPAATRGREGEYKLAICSYWQLGIRFREMRKNTPFPWPGDLRPLALLAFAYVEATVISGDQSPQEGARRFPGMVAEFFEHDEAIAAFHFAHGSIKQLQSRKPNTPRN